MRSFRSCWCGDCHLSVKKGDSVTSFWKCYRGIIRGWECNKTFFLLISGYSGEKLKFEVRTYKFYLFNGKITT